MGAIGNAAALGTGGAAAASFRSIVKAAVVYVAQEVLGEPVERVLRRALGSRGKG